MTSFSSLGKFPLPRESYIKREAEKANSTSQTPLVTDRRITKKIAGAGSAEGNKETRFPRKTPVKKS
jgi:ribosomal protein L19E